MSGAPLRTFAFGDLDAGTWGAAWVPPAGDQAFLAVGDGAAWALPPDGLRGHEPGEEWRLEEGDLELLLSPAGPAVCTHAPDEGSSGFDQLCRVRGGFLLGDVEHQVDCLGCRGARSPALALDRFESIRSLYAWFEPGDGLAVLALRPTRARGHGADVITAALLDSEDGTAVAEPRLSTTYSSGGRPARFSVELWLGSEEEEEPQYTRRTAGEAVGSWTAAPVGAGDAHAELLRCRSAGRQGTGVYLMLRGG